MSGYGNAMRTAPAAASARTKSVDTDGRLTTRSGNPSSYKAVIEANQSGHPGVEKLEPFFTQD